MQFCRTSRNLRKMPVALILLKLQQEIQATSEYGLPNFSEFGIAEAHAKQIQEMNQQSWGKWPASHCTQFFVQFLEVVQWSQSLWASWVQSLPVCNLLQFFFIKRLKKFAHSWSLCLYIRLLLQSRYECMKPINQFQDFWHETLRISTKIFQNVTSAKLTGFV